MWCEAPKGYVVLYFADYNVIKFMLRRHDTDFRIKIFHGPTQQPINKYTYGYSVLELVLEGQIMKQI